MGSFWGDHGVWNFGLGSLEEMHPKRCLLRFLIHQGSTKSLNHSKQRSTLPR